MNCESYTFRPPIMDIPGRMSSRPGKPLKECLGLVIFGVDLDDEDIDTDRFSIEIDRPVHRHIMEVVVLAG